MKITLGPGVTVKDKNGVVLGVEGQTIDLDEAFSKSLITGGSAEPADVGERQTAEPLGHGAPGE